MGTEYVSDFLRRAAAISWVSPILKIWQNWLITGFVVTKFWDTTYFSVFFYPPDQ